MDSVTSMSLCLLLVRELQDGALTLSVAIGQRPEHNRKHHLITVASISSYVVYTVSKVQDKSDRPIGPTQ